jgi:hypothetical protein
MARRSDFQAAVVLWLSLATAPAQTLGAIEGLVRDSSDALVAGAAVRVVDSATGAERRLHTGETGRYLALRLPPGSYEVSVSHPGFREQVQREVPLLAGATARVDFVLVVGGAQDRIDVTAEVLPIAARASDWGESVSERQLGELPLNGRDLFDLAAQQAGASFAWTADRTITSGAGLKLSIHGARPNQNSFLLDGLQVNDATGSAPASAAGRFLGVETIRELRVVTSPFSADLGRAAGAVVTAVSKSGSNEVHGSAYGYARDSVFDARNFFDPAGEEKAPLRRHQFGGLLSGPLQRNRIFALGSFEGLRDHRSQTVRPAVPTLEARQGLLPAPGGGARRVTVAPEVRPYLDLLPRPNGRDFGDGAAEFVHPLSRSTREDYLAGKIDFLASPRLRFSGRYTGDWANNSTPDPLELWRYLAKSAFHLVHAEAQYIPSANTVYQARAGFSRVWNLETAQTSISPSLAFVPGQAMGTLEIVGLDDVGGTRARVYPRRYVLNEYQWHNDLARVSGPHSLRLGGGFSRSQLNQVSDNNPVGRYQFNSLSDFLEGRTRAGDLMLPGSNTARGWRQNQFYAYVQEDYRAGSNLSFSLGLRYEAYSTPSEVNGKVATLRDPLRDPAVTVGGPIFRNPSQDNLAPRAALAWDPFGSGRTVLRAGAGIFFDLLAARDLVIAGVRLPPFYQRVSVTRPAFPNLLEAARAARPAPVVDGLEYDIRQPYVAQWQISVERQWKNATVARLGYAGSRGVHLLGQAGNINPTSPELLADGRLFFPAGGRRINPAFDSIGFRQAQFNSFHHGLLVSLEQRWRRHFRLQARYSWSKTLDEASNSIFTDFSNGDLVPTVFRYRLNRGPAAFDVRHRFTADASYQAPRGLGGWELHGLTQIQTGYPFSPSVGFDRARLLPASGDLGQRPDLAPGSGPPAVLGGSDRYFDPLAFRAPEAGFLGNLGRGVLTGPGLFVLDLALHKVIWRREGHAVRLRLEAFNVTNRPNLDVPSGLRLFNSSLERLGTAGRITATSTGARQVQLAARWTF